MTQARQKRQSYAEGRIAELIGEMTLDEKLAQLTGVWTIVFIANGVFDRSAAERALKNGIGHLSRVAFLMPPKDVARCYNQTQEFLCKETRLGIPALVHEESKGGFTAFGATCFPMPLAMASSFDVELVECAAQVIGRQMRSVGALQTAAPVVDIARDPRWGRCEQTYGEDPYLTSRMGVAYVKGLQSPDLKSGAAAIAKHFAGYGASEGGLNWAPARMGRREFLDVHLAPFAAMIAEANLQSLMCAYHEVDGVPCNASEFLLQEVLRERLQFKGQVVTDYFAMPTVGSYHGLSEDPEEVAYLGMRAGVDVELPAPDTYGAPLKAAIEKGRVPLAWVDRAVEHVLSVKEQLGLFENPYVDEGKVSVSLETNADKALARRAVGRAAVLLKNDGVLPIRPEIRRIAVLGPAAHSKRLLQGDYHFPSHHEVLFGDIAESADGVASQAPPPLASFDAEAFPLPIQPEVIGLMGNIGQLGVDLSKLFPPMTTLLEGVKDAAGAGVDVAHAYGCGVTDADSSGIADAVAKAKAADLAIVAVGERSGHTLACTTGETRDRAGLNLLGRQQELVEAVVATGTPTVVIVMSGRPLALPWIAEHAAAMIYAWPPGAGGGAGLADVLFGAVNPAGRLPISLPRDVGQTPTYYGHKPSGARTQVYGAYADMPTKPLFSFGHGLSYTSFEYGDLSVKADALGFDIGVTVTNVGARDGDEVVQLYLRDVAASVTRPVKELKGFCRAPVKRGQSLRVRFLVDATQLAFHGLNEKLQFEPGDYEIMIGAASDDIRVSTRATLGGPAREISWLEVKPTAVHLEELR